MKLQCCNNSEFNNKYGKKVGQVANLLKTIAEDNRLKILCVLKKKERCVCDIWQDLGIPQNLASHHLKVLKTAGLIDSRKEGSWMIYRIKKKEMTKFISLLNNFISI